MTTENINKLVLGTVQLGLNYGINNINGKPTLEQAFDILNKAWEIGIRYLDTAESYGDSQKVIGQFHAQNPDKVFNVITKLKGYTLGEDIKGRVQSCLQDLQLDKLHCLLSHNFKDLEHYEYIQQIIRIKSSGLAEKLGVSVYTNEELSSASNFDWCQIIQLPYNVLDNWNLRGEAIFKAIENNKLIQVRSTFLQGLLLKDIEQIKADTYFNALYESIFQVNNLAVQSNLPMASILLQYALQNNSLSQVLIGVENVSQLIEIENWLNQVIPNETLNSIEEIFISDTSKLNPVNWPK
ncbi:MAG: aldo/keto reductase [Bacteroidota bacterium]|nr:aldo/keto reductase [Bacteroidota bacterium]